ncbi:MAG: hypothetical protein ACYC1I_03580, partial [Acidimicrobiales bacterium]
TAVNEAVQTYCVTQGPLRIDGLMVGSLDRRRPQGRLARKSQRPDTTEVNEAVQTPSSTDERSGYEC